MKTLPTTIAAAAIVSLVLLAGCGDDDGAGGDASSVTSSENPQAGKSSDTVGDAPTGGGSDSDVVVTVDGQTYPLSIVQACQTERDEARSTDLAVYGFAETGERVELTFRYQVAEESPTGTEQYYGSVGIASGQLSAQTVVDEPFDFLQGDRSSVSGTVSMETTPGPARTVDVEFDITCP